jgi:16S rRNA (guanine527-N7)-methyltransferase
MELIRKYFPQLSHKQLDQLNQLFPLYEEWNSKINVISRKDMDQFYERHVLHSMAIAQVVSFHAGTEILDVGTGGGFPGIPLAILFPQVEFTLVDSIGKKIKVVTEVSKSLQLNNVVAFQKRAEQVSQSFDFVISRAVTQMPTFLKWVNYKIRKRGFNDLPNGVLYLKGGDLTEELSSLKKNHKIYSISDFYSETFFETKHVVHVY